MFGEAGFVVCGVNVCNRNSGLTDSHNRLLSVPF
jgi:hypothetical protein